MSGMQRVAVVGTGLVGRSWAIVFARAGFEVALWDPVPGQVPAARDFAGARLPELAAAGLLGGQDPTAVASRLLAAGSLADALDGAMHVQESGPERLADKAALFAEMDRLAAPETVLASSTSTIRASLFSETVPGRHRCLVAHPVNPPYLVPVVELSPAPWTDPEAVTRTRALMQRAGMVPASLRREVAGFVLNRLQAALVGEALSLVQSGVVSAEDLDATVKHGLGLRWSFMGPLETIDLNAPGGTSDYFARYGALMGGLTAESPEAHWSGPEAAAIDASARARLPADAHAARQEWRDRRLMALLAHKAGQPE